MKRRNPGRNVLLRVAVIAAFLGAMPVLGGCTNAQAGALWGASIGAMLGHDAESSLIGAGIGAGVGYMVGNEMDKAQYERERYYYSDY